MNLLDLAKEFDQSRIHWRAQTLTRSGDKALALAYLDARDVMDRLDEVCTPAGWQCKHEETPQGRILTSIGIKCDDEWVWKSDGAGKTAVEGEKGGISDGLKRAAVNWGVGRYLYRMDAVWVPCETYDNGGKKKWSKWRVDPWTCVRGSTPPKAPPPLPEPTDEEKRAKRKAAATIIADQIRNAADEIAVKQLIVQKMPTLVALYGGDYPAFQIIKDAADGCGAEINIPQQENK